MPLCLNENCKKNFHACGSCGLYSDWEWEYCSESCWKNSEATRVLLQKTKDFLLSLTPEQLLAYEDLFCTSRDYASMIDDILQEIKNQKMTVDIQE